ncbi:hypothetical protein RA272_30530, partial [Pseudomonas syringae pv. tagetis]|uniref:hypothetical protein n=1 Tax=Pseudomonas syringae group genomosp. 7 TaxID=251699 RepID=UPI003770193E
SEAIQVPIVFVVNKTIGVSKPSLWMLTIGLILFETLQAVKEYVAARLAGSELVSVLWGVFAEPDRQTLLDQGAKAGML